MTMYVRFDDKYFKYQRTIYSLLDFIGDVGGLMEGLQFIGYLFIAQFTAKLFKASVMRKLYLENKDIKIRDNQAKRSTVSLNLHKVEENPVDPEKGSIRGQDFGNISQDAIVLKNKAPELVEARSSKHSILSMFQKTKQYLSSPVAKKIVKDVDFMF